MSQPIEKITLDELFNQYDTTVDSVVTRREKLIKKLELITDELHLGSEDSASMLEAKVSLINSYNQILKGQEGSQIDKVKLRLQDKRLDVAKDVQQHITEALKRINIASIKNNAIAQSEDVDSIISSVALTQCDPIEDDELIGIDE